MNDWSALQAHYERCLETSGRSPAGVDWPNASDLEARFATQFRIVRDVPKSNEPPLVLDLGCGPGLLIDWLTSTGQAHKIRYRGIDVSEKMVASARERWPKNDFMIRDIVAEPLESKSVDVVIMNGVLTERREIPLPRMVELAQALIAAAFRASRHGIVFNVMSAHVDWKRDDLFHWDFDDVARFLTEEVTRHIAFDAAYGLFEFTCFAWREPQRPAALQREWWRW